MVVRVSAARLGQAAVVRSAVVVLPARSVVAFASSLLETVCRRRRMGRHAVGASEGRLAVQAVVELSLPERPRVQTWWWCWHCRRRRSRERAVGGSWGRGVVFFFRFHTRQKIVIPEKALLFQVVFRICKYDPPLPPFYTTHTHWGTHGGSPIEFQCSHSFPVRFPNSVLSMLASNSRSRYCNWSNQCFPFRFNSDRNVFHSRHRRTGRVG